MNKEEERPFYQTTITITILSRGSPASPSTLREIDRELTKGGWMGAWRITDQHPLDREQIQEAIRRQGGDPTFFGLDEEEEETR